MSLADDVNPSLGPQGSGAMASPPEVGGVVGDHPPADGGAPAVGAGGPAPPGSDGREQDIPVSPQPPIEPHQLGLATRRVVQLALQIGEALVQVCSVCVLTLNRLKIMSIPLLHLRMLVFCLPVPIPMINLLTGMNGSTWLTLSSPIF